MEKATGACCFPAQQAIVVGGGLAGFSAAHTIIEHGGKCLLLDKSPFCGGNSTKATSGINGSETKTQKAKGVKDTNDIFIADTLKGGAKKPEVAKVLCIESGPGVDWLMDKFELDLSLLARLGGHSMPRTHRGAERFPGMTITYALMQTFEKLAEQSDRAKIINKAKVTKLIVNGSTDSSLFERLEETMHLSNGAHVVGCVYEKGGVETKEYGPVILTSGGFGADFGNDSLLAKYRPDLLHLPTTNGEHCTGDAIKMGEAIGAATIDLEWVQVHPTGLVKPDDADAKVKFLAAEALRGVGGILIDAKGERFANELGRRDYVTGRMWKNKPPFRLMLNSKAAKEIHWHCEHYKGRGVMKYYKNCKELAEEAGFSYDTLAKTMATYNGIAAKMIAGEPGAPYEAYGGGMSWDPWGKKFFHNVPVEPTDEFHVAIVTPVIHYCMGGLEIDEDSRVVKMVNNEPVAIPGLYAAGEIAGGVHGNNRLGGNSLLDCVVFGRVAGKHAAQYVMGECIPTFLDDLP